MNHFLSLYVTQTNLFLVILLSIILVIFNTHIHSLFAEQQNLTNPLSLYNFSSEQEKKLFLQKWLNFSTPSEQQKILNATLAIPSLND